MADMRRAVRSRAVMLANVAYVGHMWELYAMWGSMGAFISGLPRIASHRVASLVVFGILAAGSAGCLLGARSATGLAVLERPRCAWSAGAQRRWRPGLCIVPVPAWSSRCPWSGASR